MSPKSPKNVGNTRIKGMKKSPLRAAARILASMGRLIVCIIVFESIMIAPVYEPNAVGRYVYLPEDMLLVIFKSSSVRKYQIMKKGMHYIPVAANEVPLFIRRNKLLPLCRTSQCTDEMDTSMFEIIAFTDDNIEYNLYEDDGISKDYDNPDNMVQFAITDVDGVMGAVSNKTIVKLSLF